MTILELSILIIGLLVCGAASIWIYYDFFKQVKRRVEMIKEYCPSEEEVED